MTYLVLHINNHPIVLISNDPDEGYESGSEND